MSRPRRVELLCLGDELLLGIRPNSHVQLLGELLSTHGLPLRRSHELPDDLDVLREAFREAWGRADLLITTGGLGPTTDDLTREAVAEMVDRPLEHREEQELALRDYFRARGYAFTENNLRQCQFIQGAEALPNPHGTAPGQWLEADGKIVVLLPGPPAELEPMLRQHVLPRLVEAGWARPIERFLQLRTTGIGESALGDRLEPLLAPHAGRVAVAYCFHDGVVDVRLSAVHGRLEAGELESIAEEVKAALGDSFSHLGDDPLEAVLLRQLRERGRTLAVAESCTGGLLASHFTDIAGSSRVFMGGLVCYRNEAKENLLDIPHEMLSQHGAVSPEVAVAMATATTEVFECDYALSVTGFAGPEGGNEPAGTIYIGLASPMGVWARKVVAPGSRRRVKERAVNAALDFLRRQLKKYEIHDFLDRLSN